MKMMAQWPIGKPLVPFLCEQGFTLRTFDRLAQPTATSGHMAGDLRNSALIRRAVQGVDAVVHMGAISSDSAGNEEQILSVNVQGTWNVLLACAEAGVQQVVYLSSVNALGSFGGHRPSATFPINDSYPPHPISAYQLSKHLGEELCRSFSARYGLRTLCLRPVWVTSVRQYAAWQQRPVEELISQGQKDYWAYVDVRDVCSAILLALRAQTLNHATMLLAATDTSVALPTITLIERCFPTTPWPGVSPSAYLHDQPYRSLVDTSAARALLGWQPQWSWRDPL
jgi:UDP-glucose 4-epimerase